MRHTTRLLGSMLTLALLGGCQDAVTAPGMDGGPDLGMHPASHDRASPAAQAMLSHQLQAVREATRQYRDIAKAEEDGYVAISPFVPGMGFHFADPMSPFGADREDPPVLVYFPNGSYDPAPGEPLDEARMDDLILGAVEYLVPRDQTADAPDIFADETSPRTLLTTEEEGWHYEVALDFTGLHAWVHRGNPSGVFHSTNPNIGGGGSH